MTDKQKHWISDPEGVYAQVDGAAARDEWTKVHGWADADEPGPTDQVHVVNENPEILPGRLPYAAVELHAGLGWRVGPPPSATPEPAPSAAPAKSSPAKASATSGDKKEQVNG